MRNRSIHRTLSLAVCLTLAISALAFPVTAYAATAKELHDELIRSKAEYAKAGREALEANHALEDTDDRIKDTDRRLASDLKKLKKAEQTLGKRAQIMYKTGDESTMINFVLGAGSFEDLVSRLDYVQLIAERDAGLVKVIKEVRVRLAKQRAELVASRKVRVKEAAVSRQKRDAAQAEFSKAQSKYQKLQAQLAAAMAAEKARNGITYAPGANGMVFPVQGPNYYANTWGAPRSNGRTHKGTDIMANTGVPCVAVVSGTVRISENGLGGHSIHLTGSGWEFYYAHLSRYAVRGGHVRAGQVIGYVGYSGNANENAPHLHFQMGPGGRWVNPYPYLRAME